MYWFCHISKWICHRCTCVPHPEPSSLPIPSLWVVPVHQPQASKIVHRTWTGDSFHIWYYTYFNTTLPNHPTLSLSHRVQKTVLCVMHYIWYKLYFVLHITVCILCYLCCCILYIHGILCHMLCILCIIIVFFKIYSLV